MNVNDNKEKTLMKNTTRKIHLSLVLFATIFLVTLSHAEEFEYQWKDISSQTWTGQWFWANRLQDWRVESGRLECIETRQKKPLRTLHVLPVELKDTGESMTLSVQTGMLEGPNDPSAKALAGFLIGAGADMDYRSAAIIHHSPGNKGGLIACVTSEGFLQFRDMTARKFPVLVASDEPVRFDGKGLLLQVKIDGDHLEMTASHLAHGKKLGSIRMKIDPKTLKGNFALLSHPGTGKGTRGFWFNDLSILGDKVTVHSDRTCGPILSTQHTLSRTIMKLSAQMMPLGDKAPRTVTLEEKCGDTWKQIASGQWQAPSYTVLFRVENWDSTKDHACRVTYRQTSGTASNTTCHYDVKIAHDPVDRDVATIAAFTGNHNNQRGIESGFFDWSSSVWFPHNDIIRHVATHQPDVLYFSGDQVYEGQSPTAADREEHPNLDYLYKWYLWCWAYRDLTHEIVSICVPDDHDVFQGNLWGQDGRKTNDMDAGGYVMPADFVKMSERTQTCHLPDPFDPTPVKQGIGVYYTSLDFGGVSYAILEDRKFKTGYKSEEALSNDPTRIQLLGNRQLDFLKHWAADWAPGIEMKCVLSQTIFGCLHTGWAENVFKSGPPSDDHDTNGWPVQGRNKALREIRKSFAFMIGGDQHLATIVHHGIEDFDDAGWSFCVPSVANFYPRSWIPDIAPVKPIPGLPEYTGGYHDGFGNKVTVWAAANPTGTTGVEPAALHDRSPGYGIVHFNKKDRTIRMECWPRYAKPGNDEQQYKGWPKTIGMLDNYGRKPVAWLPKIEVSGFDKPVLQVINQQYGDIVYTLRLPGNSFQPWVFHEGHYTLRIGQPGTRRLKVIADLQGKKDKTEDVVTVEF